MLYNRCSLFKEINPMDKNLHAETGWLVGDFVGDRVA